MLSEWAAAGLPDCRGVGSCCSRGAQAADGAVHGPACPQKHSHGWDLTRSPSPAKMFLKWLKHWQENMTKAAMEVRNTIVVISWGQRCQDTARGDKNTEFTQQQQHKIYPTMRMFAPSVCFPGFVDFVFDHLLYYREMAVCQIVFQTVLELWAYSNETDFPFWEDGLKRWNITVLHKE